MVKNIFAKSVMLGLLSTVLAAGSALPAFSATRTVTSSADTGVSGTLRYEIANATSGDTIVFALTYPATITLSSALTLDKNLTISGPGVNQLTISGNNSVRVFDITAGTITLADLTIAYGRLTATDETGAGLRIGGTSNVTLDRCMVRDCSLTHMTSQTYGAGVKVASTATLTVLRSCFYNNQNAPTNPGSQGGAIDNQGTLTLVDSLCVSNTAYLGAAIIDRALSPKLVTITNCTFTGNSTDNQGVVFHWGSGTMALTNCTITKNYSINSSASYEAGLSVYNNPGPGGAAFTMKNTVVAGNVPTAGLGDSDIYIDTLGLYGSTIAFTSGGYNLIGSTGSQTYIWAGGDIVGTESSKQLANLANLGGNGGWTYSHVPNVGSQVINPTSSNGSTFVDGRGYLRNSTSEKGATEYQGIVPVANAATLITGMGFNANWNSMTGATGYLLDVATDAGFTAMVSGYWGLNVGNVTTYAVTGLASGTTYYYRVRGYNGANQSYHTNTISATLLVLSPTFTATPTTTGTATPTITLTATPTSTSTATATWTASSTVTPSSTVTASNTITNTVTATPSRTNTASPTHTLTSSATATVTLTVSATRTMSATMTRSATATMTLTASLTPTPTATVTASRTASLTITTTPTITVTSTQSPVLSATPTATATRTALPTSTSTPALTATLTSTVTALATATATATAVEGQVRVYPNPARTRVYFGIPLESAGTISIGVYNLSGERIARLTESRPAGYQTLTWDCSGVAAGVYVVQIKYGNAVKKVKLAIRK